MLWNLGEMGGGLFLGVLYLIHALRQGCAQEDDDGLFPLVFNLAAKAKITANATCGEDGSEVFCKLVEHVRIFPAENRHCDICDARSPNRLQTHPIRNAIDGSNRWWQSPTITNGGEYNYVTITLDLGQIYQVAYVIVKAANSPRPGNWILERSVDGNTYKPWQYFAMSNSECWSEYGIKATLGIPISLRDDEVICTSRYSRLNPLENGEIFISLVNGRPGVQEPSKVLLEFTSARFIRLRLQKIRTLNADLMTFQSQNPKDVDPSVTRRYYYSIKDISLGGQCICYGHAKFCQRHDRFPNKLQCRCEHNTCGDNCERCCPGYHQQKWNRGRNGNGYACEQCNCHEKTDDCVYNATVDALGLSLNMQGVYSGGGVCLNCREYTTGINCERCVNGYYRLRGMPPTASFPCRQCNCRETRTSTSTCIPDDSKINEGLNPGDCVCKPGFGGSQCNRCSFGYYGFPNCRPCLCNPAGSINPEECRRNCICKKNVEGRKCDQCKPGYYNLNRNNPEGCTQCFCFGVSSVCESADWGHIQVLDMNGWVLTTLQDGGLTLLPRFFGGWLEAKTYLLNNNRIVSSGYPIPQADIHYWLAPMMYIGNRLSSYGGMLKYTLKYTLDNNIDQRYHLREPDVIIKGNGMTISNGRQFLREVVENDVSVRLQESEWMKMSGQGNSLRDEPISKQEFVTVLQNVENLLIRASYHTAQDTVYLRDVSLEMVSPLSLNNRTMSSVEQCQCPDGYAGLSCESCAPGYRRLNNRLFQGICRQCDCHRHSTECDHRTGQCVNCQHNTTGDKCDRCLPGFYGDPRRGTPRDCKPCACPHLRDLFSGCVLSPSPGNRDDYRCLNCREGQTGKHCERCAPGYYGNPQVPGGSCQRCYCSGNIDIMDSDSCDPVTGACLKCSDTTEGEFCEKCRRGYYGSAVQGNCRACECYIAGSYSDECDPITGQCSCKPRFIGRTCQQCQPGYGDVQKGCPRCQCSRIGSLDIRCDPVTGQCPCRPGIGGIRCDQCQKGYYGLSSQGCTDCMCNAYGTRERIECDQSTGQCMCLPNVVGEKCNRCEVGFWGIDSRTGCLPCDCSFIGSLSAECDLSTGQCRCRTNVGGRQCDRCQPGYYGFSYGGCQACDPCILPGHVCDPDTGKCVCPPNTRGPRCEECKDNSWNYTKDGCKENVRGAKCAKCKQNTFSLDPENPKGCTACYCFGRSQTCSQAPYAWDTISLPTRRVAVVPFHTDTVSNIYGFNVVPQKVSRVSHPSSQLERPLYWSLPQEILGDKILSYNGKLDFIHYFESSDTFSGSSGERDRDKFSPFVVISGNGFILSYGRNITLEPRRSQSFSVQFHENYWNIPGRSFPVSRNLLMVVLQNLDAVFIRATEDGYANYMELGPVSLQVAEPITGSNFGDIALGIELCSCPPRYAGSSCQDPAPGYYRVKNSNTNDLSQPEIAIGDVQPCSCHDHSKECHPETGACLNCQHNTTGHNCEKCLTGFYGVATRGSPWDCAPCACPLIDRSNSFSSSCEVTGGVLACTNCSEGYIGDRCERCLPGYWGNPMKLGGKCEPCKCNKEGSVNTNCDTNTGRCDCLPGIEGFKCNECNPGFTVQNGTCVSCFEGCTGVLLNDLKDLNKSVAHLNISVPLPWATLRRLHNQTKDLWVIWRNSQIARGANIGEYRNQTNFLAEVAIRLLLRVNRTLNKANGIGDETATIKANATSLVDHVEDLYRDIRDDISKLEDLMIKLFHNKTGVDITKAFKEAKRILRKILGRDFRAADNKVYDENLKAEKLSELIRDMSSQNFNTSEVAMRLEDLRERFQDLHDKSKAAQKISREVIDEESLKLASKLADLEDVLEKIRQEESDTDSVLDDAKYYIREAKDLLDRLRENILNLEREYTTLETIMDRLMDMFTELERALPRVENLVRQAWRHARELSKYANDLDALFDKTRADADAPKRAANVYKVIVNAIKRAEDAARKALKTARDSVRIANLDSLKYDVEKSMNRSRELMKLARDTMDKGVAGLDADLLFVQGDLTNVMMLQNNARNMLNMLHDGIDQLPRNLDDKLARVIRRITLLGERVNTTSVRVDNIIDKVNNLKPKAEKLDRADLSDSIQFIKLKTKEARTNVNLLKVLTVEVDEQARRTQCLKSNLTKNILKLQDAIRLSRELANSMKISMKDDGKCVRSYRSVSEPGVTNTISLGLKLNKTQDNMLLALMQKSPQEYLAVELRNNKVRFSWNVGGGEGTITHDEIVKLAPADSAENEKWYKVKAKRIGRIGLLKVYQIKQSETTAVEMSGTSPPGHSVLKLDENSDVFLGGSNAGYPVPPGLSTKNFTGCMGEVKLDGMTVGVFNFKNTSAACSACIEVPSQPSGSNVYNFDGTGYAEMSRDSGYRSDRINIALEFKTYWQNALLHFSGNTQAGDFLSVELREGKVAFTFYNGGMSLGLGMTKNAYNTNKWIKVQIERSKLEGLLRVNYAESVNPGESVSIKAKGKNNGLDLKGHPMYFAGIPDSMDLSEFKKVSVIETTKFLGCMRNVGVGGFSPTMQNLFSGNNVGMTGGCPDFGLRKAGFYGEGFMSFKGKGLAQNKADISLSFQTKQNDAVLLLAMDTEDNYYSLSLKDGKVHGLFSAGTKQPVKLTSAGTWNDGKLHNIAVIKANRKFIMLIDDMQVAEGRLPRTVNSIPLNKQPRLYLGGIPRLLDVTAKIASTESLKGCVSDIIINGKLLNLNLPVEYVKADIGRCIYSVNGDENGVKVNDSISLVEPDYCAHFLPQTGTPLRSASTASITIAPTMPTTLSITLEATTSEGPVQCAPSDPYAEERGAFTFGDNHPSFAEIRVKKRAVSKSFNISFYFRTYYKNGMFFLLTNIKQSDFLSAQIKNGQVEVSFYHEGDQRNITSVRSLADGKWHLVQVNKGSKYVNLQVGNDAKIRRKIARRLDVDAPLYVGQHPNSSAIKPNLVPHSIRGCLRDFTVNGEVIDIADTKVISSIGPCHKKIETGAFFTGKSSAIFATSFEVGEVLTISLEFRTNQQNGMLVTISSDEGKVGLTLEIYRGRVKFTIKNEDGSFTAESANKNLYIPCDQNWHRVTAKVVRNVLVLQLDNEPKEFGSSGGPIRKTLTKSPLFIGGVPDAFSKQGAASSASGFKGCIRNLNINGTAVDWYKLQDVVGVQRTACPEF